VVTLLKRWVCRNPSVNLYLEFMLIVYLFTPYGVLDVRYLSPNLTFQELFASDDEQVVVARQVSSSVPRRIVSYFSAT